MNKILYQSHFDIFRKLEPHQVFELINKIGDDKYQLSDPICIGIWLSMERDFKVQEENYMKTVERNRLNGKKGGRPKTQDNPKNPLGYLETQKTQPNPENLKDKGKDKGKDKDKGKENTNIEFITNSEEDFFDVENVINKLLLKKGV
jgi:hypothetical protein